MRKDPGLMRIYAELAPWFHLLTHPDDYAVEAARYERLILESCPHAVTLLELGSGGGNNAMHLKRRFTCTLSDLSPQMLAASRGLNPECEHVLGDMRTLRLGRQFDAVFAHDAVMYMTTEDDLRDAVRTAFAHTREGGVALFVPDCSTEAPQPEGVRTGGHDGDDGRQLRYLEWTTDPDPRDTTYTVDFAIMLRDPDGAMRVVGDHHVFGIFSQATWLAALEAAGFDASVDVGELDYGDVPQPAFIGLRS
jgi:methyltransferase family protein